MKYNMDTPFYRRIYKVFWAPVRAYFKLVFRVKVEGLDHIPDSGATVLCCNHLSMLDPAIFIAWSHRQASFMAKSELFEHKLLGWFLRKMDIIPIKRGKVDVNAMKTCLKWLKAGKMLGIFPEGTRQEEISDDIKAGVGMLTYRAKATLLPVGIAGRKKKKNGRVAPFAGVRMVIGEPIPFDALPLSGNTAKDYEIISETGMNAVKKLVEGVTW